MPSGGRREPAPDRFNSREEKEKELVDNTCGGRSADLETFVLPRRGKDRDPKRTRCFTGKRDRVGRQGGRWGKRP